MGYVLLGFLAIHLLFAGRRAKSGAEFFIAGGQQRWLKTGFSLAATVLGASAILGTASWGYRFGIYGSLWLLSGSLGLLILALLVHRLPGKGEYWTLPHLVSERGGVLGRRVTALALVLPWIAITAAQFRACSVILKPHLGWNTTLLMGLSAFFVTAYLLRGGQRAVLSSDFFQFVIIMIGIVLGITLLTKKGTVTAGPAAPGFFSEIGVLPLIPVLISYIIGPDIHSRLLTAARGRQRQKALLLAALIIGTAGLAMAYIGWSAHRVVGEVLPDSVVPVMSMKGGVFLGALFNLAILAALVSSADTTLFSVSAMLCVDVFGKEMRATRVAIPIVAAGSVVVGAYGGGIIPLMMLAYELFAGIVGPLVFWTLFVRAILPRYAMVFAPLSSLVVFVAMKIHSEKLASLGGFSVGLLLLAGFWIVSRQKKVVRVEGSAGASRR